MAPVILKMDVHCKGCAKKIRKAIENMFGVERVWASPDTGLVVITGTADALALRRQLRRKTRKSVTILSDGTAPELPPADVPWAGMTHQAPPADVPRAGMMHLAPPATYAVPPPGCPPYYACAATPPPPLPAPPYVAAARRATCTPATPGHLPSTKTCQEARQRASSTTTTPPDGCCSVQ